MPGPLVPCSFKFLIWDWLFFLLHPRTPLNCSLSLRAHPRARRMGWRVEVWGAVGRNGGRELTLLLVFGAPSGVLWGIFSGREQAAEQEAVTCRGAHEREGRRRGRPPSRKRLCLC